MTRVTITTDQAKLLRLQKGLRAAGETGLTRELNKGLRLAAIPVAEAERAAAQDLPSKGQDTHALRQTLAGNVKIGISRSRFFPGARIYIPRGTMPGWAKPGRDTNRPGGWRHPIFGKGKWVQQISEPLWWTRTARHHSHEAEVHVVAAMDRVAKEAMRKGVL